MLSTCRGRLPDMAAWSGPGLTRRNFDLYHAILDSCQTGISHTQH